MLREGLTGLGVLLYSGCEPCSSEHFKLSLRAFISGHLEMWISEWVRGERWAERG